MSLLLESIKIKNRKPSNLHYHNTRFNNTRLELFDIKENSDLSKIINTNELDEEITYKCRILYDTKIHSIEFIPYVQQPIKSLLIIEDNSIEYNYKYSNRDKINKLFSNKANCDDIVILKNGLITDTSYCNIALYDGKGWITPKIPLLKGTQRQFLLDNGIIAERTIGIEDLQNYQSIKLFNSMIDWENSQELPLNAIIIT